MMDLSDGLAKDLPRLAKSSGCSFELEIDAIPRHRGCSLENAWSDGEDYELLFAVPPAVASALQQDWKIAFPNLKLTRIGRLVKSGGKKALTLPSAGWDHFKD
jgi:thiamine-monophosphate kinase